MRIDQTPVPLLSVQQGLITPDQLGIALAEQKQNNIPIGRQLVRLGFVTDLLSRPIRVGYMNGIALTILVSQLPKLLGFSVDATGVVDGITELIRGIADGKTVPAALLIGLASLAVIFGIAALFKATLLLALSTAGAANVICADQKSRSLLRTRSGFFTANATTCARGW